MASDTSSQEDATKVLKLMEIYWGTKVTKAARVMLEARRFYAEKNLPSPEDIKRLNTHLRESITGLDYQNLDNVNFRRVAELIEAKLIIYNRRRSGEVQAIRLRDYARRTANMDGEYLVGGCTAFEKKLLETQEVMTIRGKVGRPVPVILPSETKQGLSYLTDPDVRKSAGINSSNDYVFASQGQSIVWAYDAVRKAAETAQLLNPTVITSTNLRKYMATVTQVLDLTENQMQWVLNHMGHTMDVHKMHYRATSDILERTQIAKILLLQDQGRVGEFKNKCLDDIDLEDVVFHEEPTQSRQAVENGLYNENLCSGSLTSPQIIGEALEEAETFFGDVGDTGNLVKRPRKAPTNNKKSHWSQAEEEEIKLRLKKFFDAKVRPKPSDCLKVIKRSQAENGLIGRRRKDVLKKKVFRMIDKLLVC